MADTERGRPLDKTDPNDDTPAGLTSVRSLSDRAEIGPLRQTIQDAAAEHGVPLKNLTVLAAQHDPFRVDTPARHRDGAWLAAQIRELRPNGGTVHLRGLHYAVLGRPKPNGLPYANTDDDWVWLSEHAAKAARWLGYVPFDRIVDQRNAAPVVREWAPLEPEPFISVGLSVDIPDADEIVPKVHIEFAGAQPYKLVLVGEKSSLEPILGPIAAAYRADLYLPTGEPSDTMLHQMARIATEDGRPLRVFYFADCDPSGWQMPVSVGRKLQALKVLLFPGLEFEVRQIALTPDQVREYGLPSTPLKDTEKRADRWQRDMGVAQTEIDSLAALQPDLLRRIARDAIDPFYDWTLDARVARAESQWRREAQARLDATLDADELARIRGEAAERLGELREQIDALNNALRIDPGDLELPPIDVPTADLDGAVHGKPLLDSRWSFVEQSRALIDSRAYRSTSDGGQ